MVCPTCGGSGGGPDPAHRCPRCDGRGQSGPLDEEGLPRCGWCGHYDFGPCPDGAMLCNGCDRPWHTAPDPN